MHSPALADLLGRLPGPPSGPAKQPTAPDLVSWSVGRMPAVAPGRAPRVEVTDYELCRGR